MAKIKEKVYSNVNIINLVLIFLLIAICYSIILRLNSIESRISMFESTINKNPVTTKISEKSIVYDLTNKDEQVNWITKDGENCSARKTSLGMIMDLCFCSFSSSIEKEIEIPEWAKEMRLIACTESAGNDGVFGVITISSIKSRSFIQTNSCVAIILDVSYYSKSKQKIELSTERNGVCEQELVVWKTVEIIG